MALPLWCQLICQVTIGDLWPTNPTIPTMRQSKVRANLFAVDIGAVVVVDDMALVLWPRPAVDS